MDAKKRIREGRHLLENHLLLAVRDHQDIDSPMIFHADIFDDHPQIIMTNGKKILDLSVIPQ